MNTHLLFGTLHLFLTSKKKTWNTTFSTESFGGRTEERSQVLVVGHVAWGSAEFRVRFDDFVHCLQEVLLGGDLPARSDREHSCLRADTADLSAWERGITQHWLPRDTEHTQSCVSKEINTCSSPVLLGHSRASSSNLMSLSTLMERAWILKMWVRPWRKGRRRGVHSMKEVMTPACSCVHSTCKQKIHLIFAVPLWLPCLDYKVQVPMTLK